MHTQCSHLFLSPAGTDARLRAAFRPVFGFGNPRLRPCETFGGPSGKLRAARDGEKASLHVIVDVGFGLWAMVFLHETD